MNSGVIPPSAFRANQTIQAHATFSTKHGRGHLISPDTLKAIGVMKNSGKKWGFTDR